jgi:HSP20 family protein
MVDLKSQPDFTYQTRSNFPTFFHYAANTWNPNLNPHAWTPPTDVYETEDRFVVKVEVAGMKNKDFCINFKNSTLFINGTRIETPEKKAFHQMEIRFGDFYIAIEIPSPVDVQKISAEYQDGFLSVSLPKAEPKQIKISNVE